MAVTHLTMYEVHGFCADEGMFAVPALDIEKLVQLRCHDSVDIRGNIRQGNNEHTENKRCIRYAFVTAHFISTLQLRSVLHLTIHTLLVS